MTAPRRPTRLLILQHRMGDGGVTYSLAKLLPLLLASGRFEITLLLFFRDNSPRMDLIPENVRVVWLDTWHPEPSDPPFDTVLLYSPLDEIQPLLGRIPRRGRFIGWNHGSLVHSDRGYLQRMFGRCEAVITSTEADRQAFLARYGNAMGIQALRLPHLLPVQQILTQAAHPPLEDAFSTFEGLRVVTVAQIQEAKRIDRMIRVHARLRARGLMHRWFLVGDGEARESLEGLARELGVADSFVFLGFRENPYPYMAGADLFAILSDHESYCLALSEAMLLGKPVLATAFPGALERIHNGHTGLVVPMEEGAIATAMEALLRSPHLRAYLHQNLPPPGKEAELPSELIELLDTAPPSSAEPDYGVWLRANGMRSLSIGWMLTTWCNFRCPFCSQDHARKSGLPSSFLEGRFSGHAFDNFSPRVWVEGLLGLPCERIDLAITGGEPPLDRAPFAELLHALNAHDRFASIRLDTNGTWSPMDFPGLDYRKLFLNVSYHTANWKEDHFCARIAEYLKAGAHIAMVNFVMSPDQQPHYRRIRERLADLGVKVNAAFHYDGQLPKSEKEIRTISEFLSPFDVDYKSGRRSPRGQRCFYPAIGLFLRANGDLSLGCDPKIVGNLFRTPVPLPEPVPKICRADHCVCLHMYSFLEGCYRNRNSHNILQCYADEALL